MNIMLQIIINILTIYSNIIIGNKDKKGFLIANVTNTFWGTFFILSSNNLLIITTIFFYFINFRNYRKWKKEEIKK